MNKPSNNDITITESSDTSITFTCILQEANKPNRNGRIYTKTSIDNALRSPIIQEKLKQHCWFMENKSSNTEDLIELSCVDLKNVCAIIEDYWWDGDLLKACCKTVDTPCGHNIMDLIKQGNKISISMHGIGTIHEDPKTGLMIVDKNLTIIAYNLIV